MICPICRKELILNDKTAVCENRHSFDRSSGGYLNLLISSAADHGDNAAMVIARRDFLAKGWYSFLSKRIDEILQPLSIDSLADLGCGEGTYTASLPARHRYGIDISKDAVKRACRKDHDTQYLIASIFDLPFSDASLQCCTTVFAPFAADEIRRVLCDHGYFLTVSPAEKHLYELKEVLYENPYLNTIKPLDTDMTPVHSEIIENRMLLENEDLMNLFQMTPYAYHTSAADAAKLQSLPSLTVTAQFLIRLYRKDAAPLL